MLPIIALVGQLASFAQGAVTTGGISASDFFAIFTPLPGSTVINNAVATYPFANQQVAGNAMIEQPLNVSLLMTAPVKDTGGYLSKLAIFTALRNSLQAHVNAGGTFHVATPSYLYTDCLLTSMADVTGGDTKQQQIQWQLDFIKPLVTTQSAAAALSGLLSKISAGQKVTSPAWSSPAIAQGSPIQGGLQKASSLVGAVNNFLAAPL
ncbi:MAG TPA: hypothetical protein PLK99_00020 [Burkholderiales bacterium]|nr:hypothetical protein [Burkholderiales bacterium]